jgi:hypothetical protein
MAARRPCEALTATREHARSMRRGQKWGGIERLARRVLSATGPASLVGRIQWRLVSVIAWRFADSRSETLRDFV